ncbi:MAG TPA: hypothetical protein VLH19_02680 [Patescibacteria group bacterium]|nr:hypothetical protein [Patescibacteria group bacterium]
MVPARLLVVIGVGVGVLAVAAGTVYVVKQANRAKVQTNISAQTPVTQNFDTSGLGSYGGEPTASQAPDLPNTVMQRVNQFLNPTTTTVPNTYIAQVVETTNTPAPTLMATATPTSTPALIPTNTPIPTPTSADCRNADLNNDGVVDTSDESILVSDFLNVYRSNPKSDINKDGGVDLVDYSLLGKVFNQTCQ